ncbi:MAG: 50S ribosomal protein L10 [Bacteroidota bacterium]
MTRAEKSATIEALKEKISNSSFFYLTDSSTLTVAEINKLRGLCFEKGVEMTVVKNTLARKAMEGVEGAEEKGYDQLFDSLKGPTAIMFSDVANVPARLIKEYRGKKQERPILKAAYIDASVYVGDDQLQTLADLKSKDELLGEIVTLLQSPAKNVISALKSGGSTIAGLLKALEEREG